MAKKKLHNPLDDLPAFDPDGLAVMTPGAAATPAGPATIEWANQDAAAIQDEMEIIESKIRQESRAAMQLLDQVKTQANRQVETLLRDRDLLQAELAREREEKMGLERQLARLQVHAEQVQRLEMLLAEERSQRMSLEKQASRMEAELQMTRKVEQQLNEERSARMNVQSRAAAAEAKAARLEGELQAMQNQKSSRGFLDRLRGG
jgi:hypothetical protein